MIAKTFQNVDDRLIFPEATDRVQHMRWHMLRMTTGHIYHFTLGVFELRNLLLHSPRTYQDDEHEYVLDWWRNRLERRNSRARPGSRRTMYEWFQIGIVTLFVRYPSASEFSL